MGSMLQVLCLCALLSACAGAEKSGPRSASMIAVPGEAPRSGSVIAPCERSSVCVTPDPAQTPHGAATSCQCADNGGELRVRRGSASASGPVLEPHSVEVPALPVPVPSGVGVFR